MVSVLVVPDVEPATWGWVPLLTALAVADAVEQAGVTASIKWPNDIEVGGAKLAGVLCEAVPTPRGHALVAGFGVNVDQWAGELPGPDATSLRLSAGRLDRRRLLVDCLLAWETWYHRWLVGDETLMEKYVARSSTLGRDVDAHLPDGVVLRGRALRLDPSGQLVLDTEGNEQVIAAADVVHVRPSGLRP